MRSGRTYAALTGPPTIPARSSRLLANKAAYTHNILILLTVTSYAEEEILTGRGFVWSTILLRDLNVCAIVAGGRGLCLARAT